MATDNTSAHARALVAGMRRGLNFVLVSSKIIEFWTKKGSVWTKRFWSLRRTIRNFFHLWQKSQTPGPEILPSIRENTLVIANPENTKQITAKTQNRLPLKHKINNCKNIKWAYINGVYEKIISIIYKEVWPMKYLPRTIDSEIQLRLRSMGALLIVGPKWCGKTTSAKQHAKSLLEMHDPDLQVGYLKLAETKPSLLLAGEKPRLLDEWQLAPVLWDAVRVAVDRSPDKGQFILTGSVVKDESKTNHTGTGRISRLEMQPMALFESGESSGAVSLAEMFDNPATEIDGAMGKLSIEELLFAACRGGWPSALSAQGNDAKLFVAQDYVNNVAEVDISKVDNVNRDPVLARALLKSYARNISTLATQVSIRKDVLTTREVTMPTIDSYLEALRKLFVVSDIPAWNPAIRSASDMRAQLKRGMCDPSVAVAALGASPESFLKDFNTFGFIFESLVLRDLKAYSMSLGGQLSYYRDRYGLEADAVLHLKDGRYALIEIKLGSSEIEMGAKHLLNIRQLVKKYNTEETQCPLAEPSFLMVITGGQMGYTRPDGVHVMPISALNP